MDKDVLWNLDNLAPSGEWKTVLGQQAAGLWRSVCIVKIMVAARNSRPV